MHWQKEKYREVLIQLSLLCRETEITTFVKTLDDLNMLFKKVTPILHRFFDQAFAVTRHCEKIDTLDWVSTERHRVIPNNASFVSAEVINQMLKDQKHVNPTF